MTGHVGIVGCSPPGAALCYEAVCTSARNAGTAFEVSMHAHDFGDYMRCIDRDDWHGVADLMSSSAAKLATTGAQLLVAPCNTIHSAFNQVASRSTLPWLHIAEEVAREAARRGYQKIGLLGTRATMEGAVYREKLAACGIAQITPGADERSEIDQMIFGELVRGIVTEHTRIRLGEIIADLRRNGCDAIGMCCTELPLALDKHATAVPLLDSTRLLAQAAVEKIRTVTS